jgi:formylglycine-generating enzyme required for sulfatase activity
MMQKEPAMKRPVFVSGRIIGVALPLLFVACVSIHSDNPHTRLKALMGISDQSVLAEIALKDHDSNVGLAALQKISDLALLARILPDLGVAARAKAVRRVQDPQVLMNVLKNDPVIWIREVAVSRLNDQSVLKDIARNDKEADVRSAAIRRLSDQSLLADIALKGESSSDRVSAMARLTDAGILLSLAAAGGNIAGAARAALFLREPAVRKVVPDIDIQFSGDYSTHSYGSGGFTSFKVNGERINVAITAQKTEDRTEYIAADLYSADLPNQLSFNPGIVTASVPWDRLLANVLGSRPFMENDITSFTQYEILAVRRVAVGKTTDQPRLRDIAIRDSDAGVRRIAVWKLDDRALLEKIRTEDKDPSVRDAAKGRLAQKSRSIELAPGVTMEMIWISPGEISIPGRDSHELKVEKGFWIGRNEVTQRQWQAVMGDNPSQFKGPEFPVENVTSEECLEFANRVNSTLARRIPEGQGQGLKGATFRLPIRTEWEFACRAGAKSRFYSGDEESDLDRVGWYDNSLQMPYKGCIKEPNAWGLYDMHGNVGEWCFDDQKHHPGYPYVISGGFWRAVGASNCDAGYAFAYSIKGRYPIQGLRCLME